MVRKKTNEQFLKEVYDLVENEYIFKEDYNGANRGILCTHLKCGYEWKVIPSNFLKGRRCPYCNNSIKNKNTKIFIKQMNDKYGDSYEVLSEYKTGEKILIKHVICGYENNVDPAKFLITATCPKCSKRIEKDTEYFKREVFDRHGDDYIVTGEYKGANKRVLVKHNKCGKENYVLPNNLLNTGGCLFCSKSRPKTTERFQSDIEKIKPNEFEVIGDYIDSKTNIKIRHIKCGGTFLINPSNFLRRECICMTEVCKKERPMANRRTHEEFQNELNKTHGEGTYIAKGKYQNNMTKLSVEHTVCGLTWDAYPMNLIKGHGCLNCYGRFQLTTADYKEKLFDLVGDEYRLIGEYVKAREKVTLFHEVCQQEIIITPDSFSNGVRCTCLSESTGERKIRQFLDKFNFQYLCEYSFDDCRNKNPLPFDFASVTNNHTKVLIEFDGKQHFEPVKFFGGLKGFLKTKINDNIKNQYCIDNNIPLLRIPYWEFDHIEHILFDFLVKHGLIEEIELLNERRIS